MISCENRGFQNHRQLECSFSSLTGLTRNKSLNILITVSFRNEFPYKRWFPHRKAQYCRKSRVRCFIYHDDVMIQFQKLYHDVIMVNKTPDSRQVAYNPWIWTAIPGEYLYPLWLSTTEINLLRLVALEITFTFTRTAIHYVVRCLPARSRKISMHWDWVL